MAHSTGGESRPNGGLDGVCEVRRSTAERLGKTNREIRAHKIKPVQKAVGADEKRDSDVPRTSQKRMTIRVRACRRRAAWHT